MWDLPEVSHSPPVRVSSSLMRCVPTIPNGTGVSLIPSVTPRPSHHQYCPLCPPRAHGFVFGCPGGNFPGGHPSWNFSHLSMLNCGVLLSSINIKPQNALVI